MASPQANTSLNEDRETLLEIRDTLAGSAALNWTSQLPIDQWEGVTVSNSRVTELFLQDNQLTGTIPVALSKLSQLRKLYLSDNSLTGTIPSELGNLSNLRWLSLRNNKLTGSIPATLGNLSYLQELWLKNNELTGSIPAELGNLSNLRKLTVINNRLTGIIPATMGNLSNLRQLWLGNNQLTGSIPAELGNLFNLRRLYLRNNQLTGTIPPELDNLSNLRKKTFDKNKLTVRDNPQIAPKTTRRTRDRYKREHSERWEAGDAEATEFYVYILKLDRGRFYAGQTRELRERLMEHRDGLTKSTAGQNPKLVWFSTVPTREEAVTVEVELKRLCDKNPREVRRRVRRFQDLAQELDFD